MKAERAPVKEAEKRDKEGRCDLPSGMAREQCTRVPRIVSVSFRVNLFPLTHKLSFIKYLDFFLSGIWTDFATRSHRKPR